MANYKSVRPGTFFCIPLFLDRTDWKLKQKLVSSQENWLKNFYEGLKDLTKDVYFVNLCAAEQFRVSSEVSFIQQRILELTNEYKKYLD